MKASARFLALIVAAGAAPASRAAESIVFGPIVSGLVADAPATEPANGRTEAVPGVLTMAVLAIDRSIARLALQAKGNVRLTGGSSATPDRAEVPPSRPAERFAAGHGAPAADLVCDLRAPSGREGSVRLTMAPDHAATAATASAVARVDRAIVN